MCVFKNLIVTAKVSYFKRAFVDMHYIFVLKYSVSWRNDMNLF